MKKKISNKEIIKRLLATATPYKASILVAIVMMILFALINAAPAIYVKNIIDSIEGGTKIPNYKFFLLGAAIIALYSFKGALGFGQEILLGTLGAKITATMRGTLYKKILYLPASYFDSQKTGGLLVRILNDIGQFQNFILTILKSCLSLIPQILVLIGVMIYRSWQLSFMILIIFPLITIFVRKFNLKSALVGRDAQKQTDVILNTILEALRGIRIVKAFTAEKKEWKKFSRDNQRMFKLAKRLNRTISTATPAVELINSVFMASIIIVGGILINNSLMTSGEMASFILAAVLAYAPLKSLSGINFTIQLSLISSERIFQILDVPNPIIENDHKKKKLPPFKNQIEISIQSFSYQGKKKILHDINLTIPKGKVIALVGKTGSGKTTLVNLLSRLYDLKKDDGFIKIDGQDIRNVKLASLRQQISVVSQEAILFNDTIENNIAYGQTKYSHKKLEKIVEQAHIDEFLKTMPKGYQEVVGEFGVRLSGGQKQRINLARAFMKDAPILVFDEPTSSLDSESEKKIFSLIEPLIQKSTTIMIAHRLSTIKKSDIIYVLKNGTIIESGSHKELLRRKKEYYKFCQMQK